MALGVIFIPIFLAPEEGPQQADSALEIKRADISQEFSSKVMPIDDELVEQTLQQSTETPASVDRASLADEAERYGETATNVENIEQDVTNGSAEHQQMLSERPSMTAWVVQAGSFSSQENAEKLVSRLRSKAYTAYIENIPGEKASYRVRIGPLLSKARAEQTASTLKKALDIDGLVLKYQ